MGILQLTNIGTNNSVFKDAYDIRLKVFSEEQGIPQQNELDEFDDTAYHRVIYVDKIPVACGRMNIVDDTAKICRIAVIRDFRRNGYATELCMQFISLAKQMEMKYVFLHAQIYIVELYKQIGFVSEKEEFIEDGIPHVRMTLEL